MLAARDVRSIAEWMASKDEDYFELGNPGAPVESMEFGRSGIGLVELN